MQIAAKISELFDDFFYPNVFQHIWSTVPIFGTQMRKYKKEFMFFKNYFNVLSNPNQSVYEKLLCLLIVIMHLYIAS